MDKINVLVIEGTKREKRESIKVARLIERLGAQLEDVDTKLADPNDFDFEGDGNDPEGKDVKYTALTEWADAFFIIVPEYNHSFPGSLKRMLDSELATYNHKPVAFAGVSSGAFGGVRAIESLATAVRELGLVVLGFDVQVPRVQEAFNVDGSAKDPMLVAKIGKVYDELLWFARILKDARTTEK